MQKREQLKLALKNKIESFNLEHETTWMEKSDQMWTEMKIVENWTKMKIGGKIGDEITL